MELEFHMPTRILLESEALINHISQLEAFGPKTLVVVERTKEQDSPALEELTLLLKNVGLRRVLFDQVEGIPTIATIEAGAALGREVGVQSVIALGGQAALDTGKAIALLAASDIGEASLLPEYHQASLPLVCIPTAPGSGAEVSSTILLRADADADIRVVQNPALFPQVALLDARYALDRSNPDTLLELLEIAGRSIEALIAQNATPITDPLAVAALGDLMTYPEKLASEASLALWEREDLFLAGCQAGMALSNAGLNVFSAFVQALETVRPMASGLAYGHMIWPVMRMMRVQAPIVTDIVLRALGVPHLDALYDALAGLLPTFTPLTVAEFDHARHLVWRNPLLKEAIIHVREEDITVILAELGKEFPAAG